MSNARNLANLLGNGTTIATASIADDAITAAKIDDDGTGFTFGDLTVAGAVVGDGFTSVDSLKPGGTVKSMQSRTDLGPAAYAEFAMEWVTNGAGLIGGCCEVGPAHIVELSKRLIENGYSV